MPVTILSNMDKPNDDDFVVRQRQLHAAAVDPKDKYLFEDVSVEINLGGTKTKKTVKLRYPETGNYIFAVFSDNPSWQSTGRDEWALVANEAIEKFCAIRNRPIVFGPRPEDTNRYNMMAECQSTRNGWAT